MVRHVFGVLGLIITIGLVTFAPSRAFALSLEYVDSAIIEALSATNNQIPGALNTAAERVKAAFAEVSNETETAPIRTSVEMRRRLVLATASLITSDASAETLERLEVIADTTDLLHRVALFEEEAGIGGSIEEVRSAFWNRFGQPLVESADGKPIFDLTGQGEAGQPVMQWFRSDGRTTSVVELRADTDNQTAFWRARDFDKPWDRNATVRLLGNAVDVNVTAGVQLIVDFSDFQSAAKEYLRAYVREGRSGIPVYMTDYRAISDTCRAAAAAWAAYNASVAAIETETDGEGVSVGRVPLPVPDPKPAFCPVPETYDLAGRAALVDGARGIIIHSVPTAIVASDPVWFLVRANALATRWPDL